MITFITKGFGQIDWTGVKSVLIHSAWIAILSVAWFLLSIVTKHDFGAYQTLAIWIIGTVSAFLKKLCETYQVAVPTY